MTLAALALLIFVQGPVIEDAHTLTDGAARAGSWLPIEVVVSSPAAFEGDVAVEIDRITVSKVIRLAAGEKQTVVVPALPWVRSPIDIVIRSGGKVLARRRLEESVRWLKDDEPLVSKPPSGVDPAYFEESAAFKVIEPRLDELRPKEAWIRTKRDAAILFIVIFAFAGFVVLLAGLRRRFGMASLLVFLAVFSIVFAGGFFALFPRGRVAVQAWGAIAGGFEYRLHFVRGGTATFARLAKPMAARSEALGQVEVHLDRGCEVRGADAALTVSPAPTMDRVNPVELDAPDVRFFGPRLWQGRTMRLIELDRPLDGVSGEGVVEARIAPRLVFP